MLANPTKALYAGSSVSGGREDWRTAVAAPSVRRLHLVMHDFEPGWDTYVERPGYGLEADLSFDQINVDDYDAILILGGPRS